MKRIKVDVTLSGAWKVLLALDALNSEIPWQMFANVNIHRWASQENMKWYWKYQDHIAYWIMTGEVEE